MAQPTSMSPALRRAADRAGFRSIESVWLLGGPEGWTARVTGVLHRYPQTVDVSLATAERLIAAGAPVRTHRRAGVPA